MKVWLFIANTNLVLAHKVILIIFSWEYRVFCYAYYYYCAFINCLLRANLHSCIKKHALMAIYCCQLSANLIL